MFHLILKTNYFHIDLKFAFKIDLLKIDEKFLTQQPERTKK